MLRNLHSLPVLHLSVNIKSCYLVSYLLRFVRLPRDPRTEDRGEIQHWVKDNLESYSSIAYDCTWRKQLTPPVLRRSGRVTAQSHTPSWRPTALARQRWSQPQGTWEQLPGAQCVGTQQVPSSFNGPHSQWKKYSLCHLVLPDTPANTTCLWTKATLPERECDALTISWNNKNIELFAT